MNVEVSVLDLLEKEKHTVHDYNRELSSVELWEKELSRCMKYANLNPEDSYWEKVSTEYRQKIEAATEKAQNLMTQIQQIRSQIHEKIL